MSCRDAGGLPGVSSDSRQPVCGMWQGGYAVLPVFASPGESSWQGEVLSGVILCVTQDCPLHKPPIRAAGREGGDEEAGARSFCSDPSAGGLHT